MIISSLEDCSLATLDSIDGLDSVYGLVKVHHGEIVNCCSFRKVYVFVSTDYQTNHVKELQGLDPPTFRTRSTYSCLVVVILVP